MLRLLNVVYIIKCMEGKEEIGKIELGNLEIPGTYIFRDEEGLHEVRVMSETFLTVKLRRFLQNKDTVGRTYVDSIRNKSEVVDAVEMIEENEIDISEEDGY